MTTEQNLVTSDAVDIEPIVNFIVTKVKNEQVMYGVLDAIRSVLYTVDETPTVDRMKNNVVFAISESAPRPEGAGYLLTMTSSFCDAPAVEYKVLLLVNAEGFIHDSTWVPESPRPTGVAPL